MTATQGTSLLQSAGTGALAGMSGAVIQVAVGLLIDKLLLPPQHDNNIAPRVMTRLFQKRGDRPNRLRDWTLGTLFHIGYGLFWGVSFSLARRWTRIPSRFLGLVMAALIYLLAFSKFGAGTKTGTEEHPRRRPDNKQLSLVAVVLTFTTTAVLSHNWLERRS